MKPNQLVTAAIVSGVGLFAMIFVARNLGVGGVLRALRNPSAPFSTAAWPGSKVLRQVPHHDVSLLDDCKIEDEQDIEDRINGAITIGAPTYNRGDHEGCFRTYERTAISINAEVPTCNGLRTALLAGVNRAKTLSSYTEKAWAMRDAFDGVLNVMVLGREPVAAPVAPPVAKLLPPPPPRNVPNLSMKTLQGCSATNVQRIEHSIDKAISLGAPLYNQGQVEGCFRIYQSMALEIHRDVPGCEGPKEALANGIREAARRSSFADKAWAMRDSFDGLLNLFDRTRY